MSNIVYAIHDFKAENEDEIDFLIGEPITVLEKDEHYLDGWWQGINMHGQTGLFPMNYTSSEKPEQFYLEKPFQPLEEEPESPQLSKQHPQPSFELEPQQFLEQKPKAKETQEQDDNLYSQHMLHPHQRQTTGHGLSARSSRSTIEEEIDQTISQLQVSNNSEDVKSIKTELWDVNQVATWLKSVGLESAADNFIDQEITGDILLDLDAEALKELGINTFGKRYKIMQAITSLKEGSSIESKPVPNSSVSTSAISRPESRKSIPSSLRRSNSQSGPSVDTSESLYQHPRKAPLPPDTDSNINVDSGSILSHHLPPHSRPHTGIVRPLSPQSLTSSGISRSNTFNTVSTGDSYKSPENSIRKMLSRKSQQSMERDSTSEWMSSSQATSSTVLNTPTPSTSTSKQPMQISTTHKLTVSPLEEPTTTRTSTTDYQAPEHEGWLHKQSDKYRTWNKRWFVLKGTNLFYFKSPKDVRMKGIINLRGYKIVVDESIHAGKYCFKAQHERERTFYFYTDTEESMRTWLKMLMKTTIARDFRAPVMSSNQIATVSLDAARRMRPRPPSVIMYKNQKQMNSNSDSKMDMVQELDEKNERMPHTPPQDRSISSPMPRLAEVFMHPREPSNYRIAEERAIPPELPKNYPNFDPPERIMNEEEDLIDPQHRSLPLDSSASTTSTVSDRSSREWSSTEYLDWVNSYLPSGKRVVDLSNAFRNGDTLIQLLESISGKEVRRPPVQKGGSMSAMMLDNIVAAFKFMGREGVEVDGRYTLKDVFSANESKIIVMLEAIKIWADKNYPAGANGENFYADHASAQSKKSSTSVLIDENSGWRGSAMMDQLQGYPNNS
ncbi:hypothetical protein BD560DRAFT_385732 [Blakeslea trispora]|nr:hypothetical protein BD560DRAFT_385732 [Blakeslea trispora]